MGMGKVVDLMTVEGGWMRCSCRISFMDGMTMPMRCLVGGA